MRWRCQHEGCTFADTGICARAAEFETPEVQCSDYLASRPDSPSTLVPDLPRFPDWTGNAIGSDFTTRMDLANPPVRVLVAGAPNSGKTSLLTGQFLELDRAPHTGLPAEFAGSYSLYGYDRLCDAAFRWKKGAGPVVPHTGRGQDRDPAWLHLAFRYAAYRRVRHLLFSDLPGEVFDDWCSRAQAVPPDLISSISVFWITVDVSRASEKVHRSAASDLVKRVRAVAGDRRVEIILTKSDEVVGSVDVLEDQRVLHSARPLVDVIRNAWGEGSVAPVITSVAAFPGADAKTPGWRLLEPLGHLLETVVLPPVKRAVPATNRYVDFVGLE